MMLADYRDRCQVVLADVFALNRRLGHAEAETDILVPSSALASALCP